MRIVIDLQGYQANIKQNDAISCYILRFCKALVRHRGKHEIILALNGLFKETIESIRAEFYELLPQGNIRLWYPLESNNHCKITPYSYRFLVEFTREAFLTRLKPDLVFITSLFNEENFSPTSIRAFNNSIFSATLLFDLELLDTPLTEFANQEKESWYITQLNYLRRCDLVFVISETLMQAAAQYLDLPAERIVNISTSSDPLAPQTNVAAMNSLDHSAQRAIAAFDSFFLKQREAFSEVRISRPKLAYVSPLPPARSGISFYSADLLPALNKFYDIEVIINQDELTDPWINEHCKIRSIQWLREVGNQYYDRVLYHFGNSQFHQHMFKLLDEVPGVVVLHDFFLTDILYHIETQGKEQHYWVSELYYSHGYKAVEEYYHSKDLRAVVAKYPSNLSILQKSLEIIVHSNSSKRLIQEYYASSDLDSSVVVPMIKVPILGLSAAERVKTRKKLNLSEKDFVVCSFGILGATKQNHRLLEAWLNSSLSRDKDCVLIFVGALNEPDYEEQLHALVSKSELNIRCVITGWVDTEIFRDYLAVTNVAVQLRNKSRGETSAAVLDCMNYGIATIVNANGSMADLPNDCILKLADHFTNDELIDALEKLKNEEAYRLELGRLAAEFIKTRHSPKNCAKLYFRAIENSYSNSQVNIYSMTKTLIQAQLHRTDSATLVSLAKALDKSIPLFSPRQLFLDISILVQTDLKTGIERVVRSILKEWLNNPPQGYRVEPIYATVGQNYFYARRFTLNFLGCPNDLLSDQPIEYRTGDVYLSLDLAHHLVISKQDFYQELRRHGVTVKFLIYDLLPLQLSYAFPKPIDEMHQKWLDVVVQNDEAICISQTVALELKERLLQAPPQRLRPFKISWFHLGADIENSAPSRGMPPNAKEILNQLKANTTFLMVGTIEPRKGHVQTLAAFEHLWANKKDLTLVIIGKQGWMMESLVAQLKSHSELGKRLFWMEGVSDEYMAKIYAASTCLIAASQGEGFGLPLIEAAQHKLYIIARDIPVFREVAGNYAYYFKGSEPEQLALAIENWLLIYAKGTAPSSTKMPWLTWEQSAKQLARTFTTEIMSGTC